ncbi:MAG: hypothetical protein EOO04_19545 [Chitinophagaceae bacterium]|nr:MAG: hypothetical protein EOO04_19545 [Chitinophagaceae bacterium]
MKSNTMFPSKIVIVLSLVTAVIGATAFTIDEDNHKHDAATLSAGAKDSLASIEAFGVVYKVLMSPRCMNCHPAGDVPLQGDDSHLHQMSPQRGKDGKGISAMKCSNCHQPTNIPGPHTPPGNPKWGLPPADMKMVFEGKTERQLAIQIMDYKQNGHKDRAKLIEHARDTLVKAGWNMGEGRVPPPVAYEDFVTAWDTWINTGGVAPAK